MRTVPDRLPSALAAVLVGWAAASPSPALAGWAGASPASIVPGRPAASFPATRRGGPDSLGAGAWREDLRVMAGLLIRLHADAFHTISREAFEREVEALRARIPHLSPDRIIVEMARVAASIGDGHTRLNLFPGRPGVPTDREDGFVRLPLDLYAFADGLHVRSAPSSLSHIVGARLVAVGEVETDEALARVGVVAHGDNPMTRRLLAPRLLTVPAVLRARGLVDGHGAVPLRLETTEGEMVVVRVRPRAMADTLDTDVLDALRGHLPRWLDDRDRRYWFEGLPGSRAVYVQLNASRPNPAEPMERFAARLGEHLAGRDPDRVVLDLRRNDGGDSDMTRPLAALLAGWAASGEDRGLYVLVGRATFSAAVVLAAELERFSDAVFVGEPTGGRPNQYGEIETFTLPNSGLSVSYASAYFQSAGPRDDRPWIGPDVAVELRFEDYAAGRDPVLEAALSHDFRSPTLAERLARVAEREGIPAALEAYRRFRADPAHRYLESEQALTRLAIRTWLDGSPEAALPVFRLVVEEHPGSFEGHENLAEVHQALGHGDASIRHALESLRLNPANGDALGLLREVCPAGDRVLEAFLRTRRTFGEEGVGRVETVCGPPSASGRSPGGP